jgi:hypothetical protein
MDKSKMTSHDIAGEFIADKIKSRVSEKYKKDTENTKKLHMVADSAKQNIKRVLKNLPKNY